MRGAHDTRTVTVEAMVTAKFDAADASGGVATFASISTVNQFYQVCARARVHVQLLSAPPPPPVSLPPSGWWAPS